MEFGDREGVFNDQLSINDDQWNLETGCEYRITNTEFQRQRNKNINMEQETSNEYPATRIKITPKL
jgi:hypothetical protein